MTVTNSLSLLKDAAGRLRDIITLKFSKAIKNDDGASVARFFKILPLINMHDYALEHYSKYLASKVRNFI